MIHIGVDLHQRFCYMTALDATGRCLKAGPVPNQPEPLRQWLRSLPPPREVAVEACSFWPAFQSAIESEVSTIRLVHPQRVKAIASAKLKNVCARGSLDPLSRLPAADCSAAGALA
jgi:transposase